MSDVAKVKIPILILFVCGLTVSAKMFLNIPGLPEAEGFLTKSGTIIASFAILVGGTALIIRHAGIAMKRTTREWPLSVYLILLVIMFLVTGAGYGVTSSLYLEMYSVVPGITMAFLGIMGVFTFTAAVRAMRAQSIDSTILLVTTILVMMANMPVGDAIWPGFSPIKTWIFDFPNTAGVRGFVMGAAIGATVLSLRVILGRDRGWLGAR